MKIFKERAIEIIKEFNGQIKQSINMLEGMIDETEDFYGLIVERLPQIEENIDQTIEETRLLINYFIETTAREDGEVKMATVIGNLQQEIEEVYTSLSARDEMFSSLEGFVSNNDDKESEFMNLLKLMEDLDEVLSDLEVLSINAIIFSVKSGEAGAGFRVISDRINRLTGTIKEEYMLIKDNIVNLQDWHNNFTTDIEKLTTQERGLAYDYQKQSRELFNNVLDSLQIISDMLNDFMNHINQVVEPIYEIIILAQNQDIIRQNMENLIKIFKTTLQETTNSKLDESGNDDLMDKLVFIFEVINLTERLMDNILSQLDESLFVIRGKFEGMTNDLIQLKEEGEEITSFFAGKEEQKEERSSLDLIYQKLIEFIPQLIGELRGIRDRYRTIVNNREEFSSNLESIKKRFKESEAIADRFNKIKLLAKIEYSRIREGDDSFIIDIEDTIKQFINSSNYNQSSYGELKKTLQNNYDHFLKFVFSNQGEVEEAIEIISDSKENLLLTRRLIKESIQALEASLVGMFSEVVEINEQLEDCLSLQKRGEGLIATLDEIKVEVVKLKEEYLSQSDKNDWNNHSLKFDELINQFTSYLERKTAQEEFSDLEVDVGSEEGELTLF